MEYALALYINLALLSLFTLLLGAFSIDEAREERRVRGERIRPMKKAA